MAPHDRACLLADVEQVAARHTAKAISGARLVILPGVGHYLPAEVYPQIAGEVRALADRAASAPSRLPGSCWTW